MLWAGVAGVLAVLWLLYKKYTEVYGLWKERGIAYISGSFPFGSHKDLSLLNRYPGHVIDEMYKKFPNEPYFGIFNMRLPFLVLRDPEIVRLVLAKEFSHFRDRFNVIPKKDDILSHHLFALEGERWRALRVKLSPTFTTGKLKGMFQHFIDCAETLEKYLERRAGFEMDVKDITGRFTTDIICSCAFGLESNAIDNDDNELRKVGLSTTHHSWRTFVRSILMKALPPSFSAYILNQLSNKKLQDFMMRLIGETLEHREKNGLRRNDFLDLLVQLKKEKGTLVDDTAEFIDGKQPEPVELSLEVMTAQCYVFFVAGFETSSSVQAYTLYELALNQEIQEKVRREMREVLAKHGGQLTYQAVQEMEYLDMVVSESMRMYPTLVKLNRRCTKTFITPAGHRIEKGDNIIIPTWSLHHDPKYFPEPEKFDPQRFSKENKDSIKPFTYLPFGEGPRICIGMRFGQLQTKIGLLTVLRKFLLEPTPQTPVPMVLATGPHSILTLPGKPVTLKFTKLAQPF